MLDNVGVKLPHLPSRIRDPATRTCTRYGILEYLEARWTTRHLTGATRTTSRSNTDDAQLRVSIFSSPRFFCWQQHEIGPSVQMLSNGDPIANEDLTGTRDGGPCHVEIRKVDERHPCVKHAHFYVQLGILNGFKAWHRILYWAQQAVEKRSSALEFLRQLFRVLH